ncbi:MAG: T9SS type A sorting domain-containing protein [Bacteroidia bacterium]
MKTPLLILTFLCLHLAGIAQILPPQFEWARSMGGWQDDNLADLVVAEDGSVYVTGSFTDFICFDTLCFPAASPDTSDIFLAKYDSVGVLQWAKVLGGGGVDQGKTLALDSQGNVFLGAGFSGKIDLGGGSVIANNQTPNDFSPRDFIIIKISYSGDFLSFLHPLGKNVIALIEEITISEEGRLYIAGKSSSDSLIFSKTFFLPQTNTDRFFIAGFEGDFSPIFVSEITLPNSSFSEIRELQSGNNGDIYLSGRFSDSMIIGGHTFLQSRSLGRFLAKFEGNGKFRWAKIIPEELYGVSIDERGHTYVTGYLSNTESFDSELILEKGNFILSFNEEGKIVWGKNVFQEGFGYTHTFYNRGQVYLATAFRDKIIINSKIFFSQGQTDILIARYDTLGTCIWVKATGSSSIDRISSINGNKNGDVVIGGWFNYSSTSFDSLIVQNLAPGRNELFIAQLHRDSLPPLPQPPAEWTVYPNPFEGHVFLWGDFVLGPLDISLFDLSGREIWKTQMLIEDTIFPIRLSVPVLPDGFYLLRLGQGGQEIVKKMVRT